MNSVFIKTPFIITKTAYYSEISSIFLPSLGLLDEKIQNDKILLKIIIKSVQTCYNNYYISAVCNPPRMVSELRNWNKSLENSIRKKLEIEKLEIGSNNE